MSNLKAAVDLFAQTVGADVNSLRDADDILTSNQGDMAALTTTHKDSLVAALNEVNAATADKPSLQTVTNLIQQAKDQIIDGAPGAYDTLKEISAYIAADGEAAAAIAAALAKRVRVDAPQNFTDAEKTQGRDNIGAASATGLTTLETGVGDYANANPKQVYIDARDAA